MHSLDLLVYPGVVAGKVLFRFMADDVPQYDAHDAASSCVTSRDFPGVIERYDAVGHRFQHTLGIVLHVLHFVEKLGIFQRDRHLGREGLEPLLVLRCEGAAALV